MIEPHGTDALGRSWQRLPGSPAQPARAELTTSLTTRALKWFDHATTELKNVSSGSFDGASRARTGDLLGAIQALSQLSYGPAATIVAAVSGGG